RLGAGLGLSRRRGHGLPQPPCLRPGGPDYSTRQRPPVAIDARTELWQRPGASATLLKQPPSDVRGHRAGRRRGGGRRLAPAPGRHRRRSLGELKMEIAENVRAFLEQPRLCVMATLNRDGSPQLTAMWYELIGD